MNPESLLMRLPSAWMFFENVTRELIKNQRSVVIYLPDHLPLHRVWGQIKSHLVDSKICYVRCDQNVDPIKAFWGADALPKEISPTIENLFACNQASDVYYVQDVEHLEPESQEIWAQFVNLWAQFSQKTSQSDDFLELSDNTPRIIMLVPANVTHFHLNSSVHLAVFHWSGIPSLIETQLICRNTSQGGLSDIQHRWYENLLPELFSGDLNFLSFLWERASAMSTVEKLLNYLCEYGQQQKWGIVNITPYKVLPYQYDSSPMSLTPDQRSAWAQGWIYHSVEYGWEVHSVLLALNNNFRDIERRIWRGQARLLLPLIDQMRLQVIEYFNNAYTEEWSAKWMTSARNEKITNPYDVDWGSLHWLSREEDAPNTFKRITFKKLAHNAWRVRNHIAHFTPVSLGDFEQLTQAYQHWMEGE